MRHVQICKGLVLCAMILACRTLSVAQTAFQLQLANLNGAISERQKYNKQKQIEELVASLPGQLQAQFAARTPPNPEVTNRKIGTALTDIVDTIVTGTAAVYTGAGLTALNNQIQLNESVWKSDHVRNGFDKTKPFLDIAGNLLVGASLVLASQKNQPGATKASGIVGAAALMGGSLLQHFLGSKTSQLQSVAGKVSGVETDIAQIEFSRAAYDDLQLRYTTAKTYYDNTKGLIPVLRDLLARCKAVRDNPTTITDDDLRKLIEDVSAARDTYAKSSDFVEAYTKQLGDAYVTYEGTYPVLKTQLDPLIAQIKAFNANFQTDIEQSFLADFPKFAAMLIDLRASVGT